MAGVTCQQMVTSVELEEECWLLAKTDTSDARTSLYLRLLYGSRLVHVIDAMIGDLSIPVQTREVLKTIDQELLKIEQIARRRNLLRHLLRAVPSVGYVISESELEGLTENFVNSIAFWSAAGRSLAENFCYFAYFQESIPSFSRDVCRLSGTVAGMTVAANEATPWKNIDSSDFIVPDAEFLECFESNWCLVGKDGSLLNPQNLPALSQEGHFRIAVAKTMGGRIVAASVSVK